MNNRHQIHAVIFDLDGVIIDSNPEIEKFWYQWAEQEKVDLNDELVKRFIHGRKGVETIEHLFQNSTTLVKEKILASAAIFDSNMKPAAVPGVVQFIDKLKKEKVQVAVVTSSHKDRLLTMLNLHDLHDHFSVFVAAEDVTKGKPDPEPYLAVAQKLDITPARCLVFEDAASGVHSAITAGMKVIAIAKEANRQDFLQMGAIDTIQTFGEITVRNGLMTTPDGTNFRLS